MIFLNYIFLRWISTGWFLSFAVLHEVGSKFNLLTALEAIQRRRTTKTPSFLLEILLTQVIALDETSGQAQRRCHCYCVWKFRPTRLLSLYLKDRDDISVIFSLIIFRLRALTQGIRSYR